MYLRGRFYGETHNLAGIEGHNLYEFVEGDNVLLYEIGIKEREGSLDADYAEGALEETATFFFCAMGCMVGCNAIYRAILDAGDKCRLVFFSTERWIHLPAAVFLEVFVREKEIMWGGLTGNRQAFCLGLADKFDTLFGGDMADMQGATCLFYQTNITLYLCPFALRANASVTVCCGIFSIVDIAAMKE